MVSSFNIIVLGAMGVGLLSYSLARWFKKLTFQTKGHGFNESSILVQIEFKAGLNYCYQTPQQHYS